MRSAALVPTLAFVMSSLTSAHALGGDAKLEQLDRTITALAAAPASVGALGQLRALVAAASNLSKRNQHAQGVSNAPPPPFSDAALNKKVRAAISRVHYEIDADGVDEGIVRTIREGLDAQGYSPATRKKKSAVKIRITTDIGEPSDQGAFWRVKATVTFEIEETDRGKVIARFREMFQDGDEDADQARTRALAGLANRLGEKALVRLDRIIKGQPPG